MRFLQVAVTAALALLTPTQAESTYDPVQPPAAPLAVRSPYLNTWLQSGDGGLLLPGAWPRFWSTSVTGWQGFIRVDGTTYNWMGNHPGPTWAEQTAFSYTSTRSTFTIQAGGKVELVAEFMSPVYPEDMLRQSITSSYLKVSVKSLDGASHDVQLYGDVSGEWASGDNSDVIQWEQNSQDGLLYHKFFAQDQREFTETNQQAAWGNWYWATKDTGDITYQIGEDTVVRSQFTDNGELTDDVDTNFRAIKDQWPVFAFARDLGSVSGDSVDTLFTIGYTQQHAVLFQGDGDSPEKMEYFWTHTMNETDIVSYFYNDYDDASSSATTLDQQVESDSQEAGGDDYATITTLSVRQVFGALAYTGTEDDPLVFLKEISSNGDSQTVDILFPMFPAFVYFNPDLINYTLKPLLIYQESGKYPNTYAIHDLGVFPNSLGYPDGNDEKMPLEECGNMIIMMLAYAQRTGDNDYLSQHWEKLQQWAGYLVDEAKIPKTQLSTDDFAGHLANQTNLAIKGIIGIEAMSQISDLTGHADEKTKYANTAQEYLDFWMEHGIVNDASPPHTNLAYDEQNSYGLLYNIFGDKVLNLDFIPDEIYDMQSAFYLTVQDDYGIILDTRNTWTKLDWEMFCASVASDETKTMFISTIANWIDTTTTYRPLTDLYSAIDGGYPGLQFTDRPVVGGTFSILALNK